MQRPPDAQRVRTWELRHAGHRLRLQLSYVAHAVGVLMCRAAMRSFSDTVTRADSVCRS